MGRIDTRLKHFLVRLTPYSQMAESGEHIRDTVGTRDDISLSARDSDKNRLFPERAIQAFVFLILISSTILHQEGAIWRFCSRGGGADTRTELQMKRNEK